MTATNALGSSLAGAGAAATPIGTPDPPVQVSASATYGEALVTWQPPANNGGSPITGYLITISPGGRTLSTPDTIFGWTGLPPSPVSFTIQAVNAYGAGPASAPSNVVVPLPGHLIIISLSQQHLWAYTNNVLWLDTVVTTGRPELPTPPGDYHIMNKQSPYESISPWPPGSPFWYPSAWVNYAMEFIPGGYYLHDAPWRSWYGPGSNLYDGTHGCVNIPLGPMTQLYAWANVGDEVIVQN